MNNYLPKTTRKLPENYPKKSILPRKMIFTLGNINFAQKNERSLSEVLTEVTRGYKMATKILKIQRKSTFPEKTGTEKPRKHAIPHHRLSHLNP